MSDLQGPPDPQDYLNRELSGRFLADAIDALPSLDPETPKIRAVFASPRDKAWTEGDVTIPPVVFALVDGADDRVRAIRRAQRATTGRQAGLFGSAR